MVEPDIKSLDLTRRRIPKIEGLDFLSHIETLCLRWNLLKRIENLEKLTTLTELDLYDNQVRDTWLHSCEALDGTSFR